MSNAKDLTLSLKVMINKEKTKVLFAEAKRDFADVLLSFLTLPLGRIVKLLEKHYGDKAPVFGSLTSLYKGLANLDSVHFCTTGAKLMLLNPTSSLNSECRKLKLDISDAQPTKYFTCYDEFRCPNPKYQNVSMYYGGTARCACGRTLSREIVMSESQDGDADAGGGVFTINTASFIISDDLRMLPYAAGFLLTLSKLGIQDIDGSELKNVSFGINEIMDLLKCSLLSENPLTDLILNNRQMGFYAAKPETPFLLQYPIKKKEIGISMKIILKVTVQKSTNKLLFAQAEDDFIELLCTFLIIPIRGIESLLHSNTSLKNLDNLYKSVADFIDVKYLRKTHDTKNMLLKPKLPHCYISKTPFLPLSEESAPPLYYKANLSGLLGSFSHYQLPGYDKLVSSFKSPKGGGNYVKEPTTYMVTDDLTVRPICMISSVSILNQLNIPLSDVDELDVHIGLEEALSILKASLTSNSALTNGVINRIVKKQPKQDYPG